MDAYQITFIAAFALGMVELMTGAFLFLGMAIGASEAETFWLDLTFPALSPICPWLISLAWRIACAVRSSNRAFISERRFVICAISISNCAAFFAPRAE